MKKLFTILFLLLTVVVQAEEKVNYQEAFLKLALQKAEKYSEKGEILAEKTVDLIMKESGPMVEEYIKWKIFDHITDAIPSIVSLIIGMSMVGALYCSSKWQVGIENGRFDSVLAIFAMIFCLLFGILGTFASTHDGTSAVKDIKLAVQASITPRIYIMEQVITVLKK